VALLIAIIVLTALFLLAVPFAVFMRLQHSAGTQALEMARARFGETGALNHARTVLQQGIDAIEPAPVPARPELFPFNNRDVDTLWEFHVPLRTRAASLLDYIDADGNGYDDVAQRTFQVDDALGFPNDGNDQTVDGYIRVEDEWMGYSDVTGLGPTSPCAGTLYVRAENRGLFGTTAVSHSAGATVSFFPDSELWALDVEDPQSKINVNSAPSRVILNLLQYAGVDPNPPPTAPSLRSQYIAYAIATYRVNYSVWENYDGDDIPDGTYTPFQNIDMVKNISVAPLFRNNTYQPLSAAEFDLIRPYITVNSQQPASESWSGSAAYALEGDVTLAGPGAGNPRDTFPTFINLNGEPTEPPPTRSLPGIAVGSLIRVTKDGVPPTIEYCTVRTRNQNTQIMGNIGQSDTTIPIESAVGFEGAAPGNPGYILIYDTSGGPTGTHEWITYTGIDSSGPTPQLTGVTRNVFGTVGTGYNHTPNTLLDGCVITLSSALGAPPYTNADTTIEVEGRHAININTETSPVILQSILYGTGRTGQTISDPEARAVAAALLERTASNMTVPGAPYNFYDGNEGWFDGEPDPAWAGNPRLELIAFLDTLAPGTVTPSQANMLKDNFDANASLWPDVPSIPLRFNSGGLVGIESLSIVDDQAGTPVAQSPRMAGVKLARVYDVVPPLEPVAWLLRSQKEFEDHLAANPSSTNVFSNPLDANLPPPADNPTYTDTDDDVGTVAPALDTLNWDTYYSTALEHMAAVGARPFDLDQARGTFTEQGGATPGVDNTASTGFTNVRLQYKTDYEQVAGLRNIEADNFHATVQPFAVEFWMRPGDNVVGRQLLVDLGEGEAQALSADNQARIYLETGQLVLRLDDELGSGYAEAKSSSASFSFAPNVWHHVAVAVVGPYKDEIAMFIDGIYDSSMEWGYHYADAALVERTADDTAVQEGYFWPVGMTVPNQQYTLQLPAPAGQMFVVLNGTAGLPARGMVAIGTPGHYYEYTSIVGGTTLTLEPTHPLGENHLVGEAVATMIPVARPAVHRVPDDLTAVPAVNDQVSLWSYTEITPPNGSFRSDGSGAAVGPETVASTGTAVDPVLAQYVWLGIDPTRFPLAGGPAAFDVSTKRWKVLNYTAFVVNKPGVLAGVLPTGPLGQNFSVGGDRAGAQLLNFVGQLDELRITSLPTAIVQSAGWLANSPLAVVQEWEWRNQPGLGWFMTLVPGASSGLAPLLPIQPTGGYFMVEGRLYSYAPTAILPGYDQTSGQFAGIQQVYDDLTPTGVAGLAQNHAGLRRIIPLNFITTTCLPFAWAGGAGAEDIPVVDASQFPDNGYVRIDNEIIAYSGRDTAVPGAHRLLRPVGANLGSAYPRGAYNTAMASHNAAAIVRLLPVRHLDRYRWATHTTYDDAQLGANMCMFSFSVPHAGRLNKVSWRFKNTLEPGQKVAVLVSIDGTTPWETDPSDTADERISGDFLWGTICDSTSPQDGSLVTYDLAMEHPTVTNYVEVRFYFDLGSTNAYNRQLVGGVPMVNGWSNMVEIDKAEIEMVPESTTF
jgi:hypothetical protein